MKTLRKVANNFTLLLYLMLIIFYNNAYAQEYWIQSVDIKSEALNSQQKLRYNEILKISYIKQFKFVRINNISDFIRDNKVQFFVPLIDSTLTLDIKEIKAKDSDNYEIQGYFGDVGIFSLINENDQYRGDFAYKNRTFEIRSLGNNLHAIIEIDRIGHEETCGNIEDKGPNINENQVDLNKGQFNNARVDPCPDYFTVLFLYTNNAPSDIGSTAYLALSQYNFSINDSNIGGWAQLVSAVGSPNYGIRIGFNGTGNIDNDLDYISANYESLRNSYRADIVVLLTNDIYSGINGKAKTNFNLIRSEAYAIVEGPHAAATYEYSFTHEVGHLLGCHHQQCSLDPFDCDNMTQYAHGYKFQYGFPTVYRETIMATVPGFTRYQWFSNPDIYWQGHAVGTSLNDNSRWIDEHINTVRAYNNFNTLGVWIDGPQNIYHYGQYTWEAIVTCGTSPYTYEWRLSSDGINYGSIVSTNYTYTGYVNSNSSFYIKVTVHSNDSQISYSILRVYVSISGARTYSDSLNNLNVINSNYKNEDNLLNNSLIIINNPYPNPVANNESIISFYLSRESHIIVRIIDIYGNQKIDLENGYLESGHYKYIIKGNELSSGIYICQYILPGSMYTKTIMIKY